MFIEIKDLSKYYGEGSNKNKALDSINVSIDKGKICVIVGSSGCGKSTLLNCIGGLEKIDTGEICVDELNIAKMNAKELSKYRRENLGFIFQFYNLIPNLTVQENVDVCKYLAKDPLDRDTLLKVLGIYDKRNCIPNTLSGGEQQRCAIARAIIKNPKILLCDEPTGALDSTTAKEILRLVDELNERYGTTIIMVTHNPAILPMAHQIITLHDGRIIDSYTNKNKRSASELEI